MAPNLDDPSSRENHNRIRVLDSAQPVRNRDGSATAFRSLERGLDDFLGLSIQRGRCLVEEEETWAADERARYAESLALAA